MHFLYRTTALTACLLVPLATQAQTVSEADAKKVEDGVKIYAPDAWSKPGFLTVKPSGDHLQMTLDLAIGLKEGLVPMVISEVTPLVQSLTKRADGMWELAGAGPFALVAQSPAANRSSSIKFNIGNYETKGVFDPAVFLFRDAGLKFADTNVVMRTGQDSLRLGAKETALDLTAVNETSPTGDADAKIAMVSPSITFGAFPKPEVKVTADRLDGGYKVGKLNFAGVSALTEFWQVTAGGKSLDKLDDIERARFKSILSSHIPFIEEIGGGFSATNISIDSSGKAFGIGTLNYDGRFEDMGNKGAAVIGVTAENLSIGPGVWPANLEKLLPSQVGANVRYTGFDFGAMWKDLALARTVAEQSKLPRDHIQTTFLPSGKMHMEIKDSYARSEIYDLHVVGALDMRLSGPRSMPEGEITVTAKEFDKTVKFLQDNSKALPALGQASFVALIAKGLGKVQPDGSLSWNIKFSPPGKTTVNGQPLPF